MMWPRESGVTTLQESGAAGTAVAATAIWRGSASFIDDQREIRRIAERIGYYKTLRSYTAKLFAALTLNETEATYEQLPYLFALLYGGDITGTADGTDSSGYTYTTNIPENSAPTAVTYTIETGDDAEASEMEYSLATRVTLSGTAEGAVMCSAEIIGRQATRTTFTGSLTLDAVEEILGGKGKLYLDATSGSFGSTQISNQLLGFETVFEAVWTPKWTMDGNQYYTFAELTDYSVTGRLTFEHDTTSVAGASGLIAGWRSETYRLMRLQFTGSAYTTPGSGTAFSGVKGLRIDLPIMWTKFNPLEEQNGNSIVVAEFESGYDTTEADAGSVVIASEQSALT